MSCCKQELRGWKTEPPRDWDCVKDFIQPNRKLELTQKSAIGDSYDEK